MIHTSSILVTGLLTAAFVGLASGAMAQGEAPLVAVPALSRPAPSQPLQVESNFSAAPTVRLFGVPTALLAPVDPSYTGAAYRTLGGQAETSADAVAEQGTPWH